MKKVDAVLALDSLTRNEPKEAFLSLKTNKSSDCDDIILNIVTHCFNVFYEPLKYVFEISLKSVVFLENLVTPLFKNGNPKNVLIYGPILRAHYV